MTVKKIKGHKVRFGSYTVEAVYDFLEKPHTDRWVKIKNLYLDRKNAKFRVFKENDFRCAFCGLVGNVFHLEYYVRDDAVQLHLYTSCDTVVVPYLPEFSPLVETPLTIDHIIPKRLGGTYASSNLQVLCKPCNSQKGSHYGIWKC